MQVNHHVAPELILASSSRYRRELLDRLGLTYQCQSPDIDERPHEGESPHDLVTRLAREKAIAGAIGRENALIIGSDQLAVCGDEILGKAGSFSNAQRQLQKMSGRRVLFLTSLCLLDSRSQEASEELDITTVTMRELGQSEIQAYLHAEQPYDCAGSFKAEGLGIALFDRIESDDPTGLIGLSLVRLCRLLRKMGYNPLMNQQANLRLEGQQLAQ